MGEIFSGYTLKNIEERPGGDKMFARDGLLCSCMEPFFHFSPGKAMKHLLLFFVLLTFAIISGCKSNSTNPPSGPTVVIPNVGTNWTIQNIRRDSINNVKKIDTSIRTVVALNAQYQGFSDVVITAEPNPQTGKIDTTYLRYLSNGDISRLSSPAIDPQLPEWFTVPYTTHVAQNFNYGGNINFLGFTHDSVSFSASYAKDSTETIAGVSYPVSIITSTTWQNATSATKDSMNYILQTNSFIPSKGIFGNHYVTFSLVKGKQVQRDSATVISVNIK
jgi:hypothetical protein